ncbi:MAG: hypothetical protein ACYDG2_18115 [Ruminiclostridium sp.]
MKLFKKKSLHHKAKHKKKHPIESDLKKSIQKINFEEYIGCTVMIYVDAGGIAGNSFSGVLLGQTATYITLLVLPSKPPSCSLGKTCKGHTNNVLLCVFCPFNDNSTIGKIAEISITSIVAFVHNNWSKVYYC